MKPLYLLVLAAAAIGVFLWWKKGQSSLMGQAEGTAGSGEVQGAFANRPQSMRPSRRKNGGIPIGTTAAGMLAAMAVPQRAKRPGKRLAGGSGGVNLGRLAGVGKSAYAGYQIGGPKGAAVAAGAASAKLLVKPVSGMIRHGANRGARAVGTAARKRASKTLRKIF